MLNDVEYLRGDLNCFNKINNYSAKHCYILNHVCYIFYWFCLGDFGKDTDTVKTVILRNIITV